MAKSKSDKPEGNLVVCRNRRARHDYEIQDTIEAGLVLTGTEVKSLRNGKASIEEAYAALRDGEVWLLGCDIPEYAQGNRMNHQPKRPRKLLLHRREIAKFAGKASEQGFTLVPLKIYFNRGRAKVELAVGRGRKLYDKRAKLKSDLAHRDIKRALSDRR